MSKRNHCHDGRNMKKLLRHGTQQRIGPFHSAPVRKKILPITKVDPTEPAAVGQKAAERGKDTAL